MRTRMLTFLAVLALGVVICMPGMVLAYSTGNCAVGDWTVAWTENGIYNGKNQTFDKMEIFVVTGNAWQNPALTNFNATGWQFDALPNPKYGVASGPDYTPSTSGNFNYTTIGVDPLTNPFVWDLFFYNDNTFVGGQRTTWNGSSWTGVELFVSSGDRSAVPIPGALVLLGAGLVRLATYGRRRKRTMV